MQQPGQFFTRAAFACGAFAVLISAHAQVSTDANVSPATARQQETKIARGDPSRWHQEDATLAARLRTIRKETAAALQENLGACRSLAASARPACVKEAWATYQLEMAGAKARARSGE